MCGGKRTAHRSWMVFKQLRIRVPWWEHVQRVVTVRPSEGFLLSPASSLESRVGPEETRCRSAGSPGQPVPSPGASSPAVLPPHQETLPLSPEWQSWRPFPLSGHSKGGWSLILGTGFPHSHWSAGTSGVGAHPGLWPEAPQVGTSRFRGLQPPQPSGQDM